jgi:hypothetical protein
MPEKYLQHFPKPLLEDLIAGRWLPFIGAGFSRNAVVPPSKRMPLWNDLGDLLAKDLKDYSPSGAVDAISAYEHEYERPKLIEKLAELLLIDEARPGAAHKAFCSLPFDLVCTTNFDFLIEREYELIPRHCTPLVDEEQLSIKLKDAGVALLKLHGDLHHPNRLVVTETDYDSFLDRFPLLATYLANLLITRTAVFVGYSLDDPDFRQVWQIVRDRLGRSRRAAYAIAVSAAATDISRFARRGVKLISLPGSKSQYGEVLAEAFRELREYWRDNIIPASQVKEEQPLQGLSLPPGITSRLCFFAIPLQLQPFYRERVFPVVQTAGFVPVTADDVVSPSNALQPKLDALLERALLFVADISSPNTLFELGIATRKIDPQRILVITETVQDIPLDLSSTQVLKRPDITFADPDKFISELEQWFSKAAERYAPSLGAEPARLLTAGEYRVAIIAAISLLENTLRQYLDVPSIRFGRGINLRQMLEVAQRQELLGNTSAKTVLLWLQTRNQIVHTGKIVTKQVAEQIVRGVLDIIKRMPPPSNDLALSTSP